MKVCVLAGGISNERDVSLRSGAAVVDALKKAGHSVSVVDPKETDDIEQIASKCDVVLLALHGKGGEDGSIQEQLEKLQKPFVGSSSSASRLCFDKAAYKQFLLEHDIPVVRGRTVTRDNINDPEFSSPYVLKPIRGGSSLDTQIVRKPDQATRQTSNDLLQKYPQMLLEPLVEGVEITVGVFEDHALPVIEIIPPEGSEFDYEHKYDGSTQEICPPLHVSESKQHEARLLAERIHKLTGCEQLSRTDMIIDEHGTLHVLETNTIPGLTDQSLYPKMASAEHIDMPQLVDELVRNAHA